MRSAVAAVRSTSGSSVKSAAISGAKTTKTPVTSAMNAMFQPPVIHTARSARSGFPAPRFWPTSVEAAFESPQQGRMTKSATRMAITQPATAMVPKLAMMRISRIQGSMSASICPIPPTDTRQRFLMTAHCVRMSSRRMRIREPRESTQNW